MAHPHNEHRDHKVQHRRVHHITHGMARGGTTHSDEASDMALIRKSVKKSALLRADGGRVKHRADRPKRASGGRIPKDRFGHDDLQPHEGAGDDKRSMHRAKGGRAKHKGHTTVNVMVSPHHGGPPLGGAGLPPPAAPPPAPPLGAAPPPVPPPGLGAPPPGGMLRPGMPPGPPAGGLPMRARGGRIADGPAYQEGKSHRPVDHAPGKMDGKDIGRNKVITYKRGGRVKAAGLGHHATASPKFIAKATGGLEHKAAHHGGGNEAPHHPKGKGRIGSEKGPMSPNFRAGGGGGIARLKKLKKAAAFERSVP